MHEIATDCGYFRVTPHGLELAEIAADMTVEEVRARTGCPLTVADPLPKIG